MLKQARERLGTSSRRTILFLDEIHRFNKAQQDALLPGVEEGLVTLIGATTENPYFEVNSALLSRAQVYELEPHSIETLIDVVRRGAVALEADVSEEIAELIAGRAGGDARNALNILESSSRRPAPRASPSKRRHVDDAARKRPLAYDKGGDRHYDFISAWIKSTRAGDVQASVYYLAAMLEGGEDARFIVRRMIVLASEDIGNADPQALLIAVAAAQAVEHVGLPEARLNLAQAAVYLARAPKSNASYVALGKATQDVREHGHLMPPAALRSAAYAGAKKLGRGEGYVYPHDERARASRWTACRTAGRHRLLRALGERRRGKAEPRLDSRGALENARAESACDQFDGQGAGLVLAVEDRIDLDDVERLERGRTRRAAPSPGAPRGR